jgi:hypothetical protein
MVVGSEAKDPLDPDRISFICTVPASVPSVIHGSFPVVPSEAKNQTLGCPPTVSEMNLE